MNTGRLQTATALLLILALGVVSVSQQVHIRQLESEAADLRAQLSHAPTSPEENQRPTSPQPGADNPMPQDQHRELLRLRGEVGVLKNQLAKALARTLEPQIQPPPEESLRSQQAEIAALEDRLAAHGRKVDEARQKADQLLTALNVPEGLSTMDADAMANMDDATLARYSPYFQARRDVQNLERIVAMLKLRLSAARSTSPL
jgi:hypothetical protein